MAAIMIAMGVSLGTLIIPMIVAAYATCNLFSDDRGCGWLTFAASAGISRRRIIASRILALLILSIPVTVIPAICTVMISPMEDHILAGLGIGTYLAGIGYGCMVFDTKSGSKMTFSEWMKAEHGFIIDPKYYCFAVSDDGLSFSGRFMSSQGTGTEHAYWVASVR